MNCVENYLNSDFSKSDKIALAFFDKKIDRTSFKQLHNYCSFAQKYYHDNNIARGDTVLIFEKLSAELYAMIIGALGLGINLLVVEPWMKSDRVNEVILKAKPKAIITGLLGKIVSLKFQAVRSIPIKLNSLSIHNFKHTDTYTIECVDMKEGDIALTAYTSGTSGIPKGVCRTHRYLVDQNTVIRNYVNYEKFPKLDLTIFTNMVLLNLNLGKGSLIIQNPWNKKKLKRLDDLDEELKVDTLACGPHFLKTLLASTQNLRLGQIYTGGALADLEIHKQVIMRWSEADLYHVYGSSEAEPVAVCDLRESVERSEKAGYFKNLFLGERIKEIAVNNLDSGLWVTGPHVSSFYLNDERANSQLKQMDEEGRTWHNMGDRIKYEGNKLWYDGRSFQDKDHFDLEQRAYKALGHSQAFIKKNNNRLVLMGNNISKNLDIIKEKCPEIDNIIDRNIIVDDRHRSRINRNESFYKGVTMKNIMMFMIKRVPLIANILIVWGLISSVEVLNNIQLSSDAFWYAMISLVIFITELRFMDELKDFEKDKVAHPNRPLPSGLVTTRQVGALVNLGLFSMIICSGFGFLYFGVNTGLLMSFVTTWLYLMYKEFFIGEALSKSPLVYAISHQVIIIPAVFLAISLQDNSESLLLLQNWGYSLFILGSFFSFEVGRKLNPNAHPILETYYSVYGKIKTHILLLSLLVLALAGGYLFDACVWPTVAISLVVIAQVGVYFKQSQFKVFEGVISVFLLYAVWMLPLMEWVNE